LGNFSESSSRIDIKQSNGLQWLVRSSRLSPQMETVLQAPDQFLEHARVLKPSRSSAVGAAGGIVLKRYNYRKWTSRFKDWFRPSRGRRSFEKAHLLETAGVRTAGPIAAAERRCCGVVVRSYFVMTEIPGAVPLGSWSGDKRAACKQVAELLARLHQEGFTHRDLKEGNILFDAAGQPHLIDLDGLRYVRETTHQQAVADLRRLARGKAGWRHRLTRSDRARFLLAYCRARGLSDWRWWWREIQQHR
jgi:serine/threonine protein kinase